jgi:hypothetical protein
MISNDDEHKRSVFHKRNMIATGASIITMYSNNDLDTTTSTVMPGVESESVNWFMLGFKWYNCKKVRF